MIKYVLVPLTLAFASISHAACVTDDMELGDTGPSSSKVCESLEGQYPDANLAVLDRKILSAETVSVRVSVDGRAQSLNHRLVGADWVSDTPKIVSNQE